MGAAEPKTNKRRLQITVAFAKKAANREIFVLALKTLRVKSS